MYVNGKMISVESISGIGKNYCKFHNVAPTRTTIKTKQRTKK
jgi:hypothetical protein